MFTHIQFHKRTHWEGHFDSKYQQNLSHFPKWSLKDVYRSVCLHRDKTCPTWKHQWQPTEPYKDGISLQTQTDHQCQEFHNHVLIFDQANTVPMRNWGMERLYRNEPRFSKGHLFYSCLIKLRETTFLKPVHVVLLKDFLYLVNFHSCLHMHTPRTAKTKT